MSLNGLWRAVSAVDVGRVYGDVKHVDEGIERNVGTLGQRLDDDASTHTVDLIAVQHVGGNANGMQRLCCVAREVQRL